MRGAALSVYLLWWRKAWLAWSGRHASWFALLPISAGEYLPWPVKLVFSSFVLPVKRRRMARGGRDSDPAPAPDSAPPRLFPPVPPVPPGPVRARPGPRPARFAPGPVRARPGSRPAGSAPGPVSARHRPCKAPVGPLSVNALAASRSGLVVFQPVPDCRPLCRQSGTRRVPLHLAGTGPPPPGSITAPRRPLSASRPAGRARAGAPSCPSPGVLPSPMRSRRGCRTTAPSAVSRHPAVSLSYAGRRSEPPCHHQLFLNFFQEFFGATCGHRFRS
jgi:hypothetical protein